MPLNVRLISSLHKCIDANDRARPFGTAGNQPLAQSRKCGQADHLTPHHRYILCYCQSLLHRDAQTGKQNLHRTDTYDAHCENRGEMTYPRRPNRLLARIRRRTRHPIRDPAFESICFTEGRFTQCDTDVSEGVVNGGSKYYKLGIMGKRGRS